jgi:hypothetical protein
LFAYIFEEGLQGNKQKTKKTHQETIKMEQAEKACPFRFRHAGMETMWANMVSYGKLANVSPAALLPRAVSG